MKSATALSFAPYSAALRAGRLLRVVNFHNTAASAVGALWAELERLSAECTAIDNTQLAELCAGTPWRREKPPVVLAFYEGYANHYAVAAPVLAELSLTAWFFVPTVFVDVPLVDQEKFANAHSIDLVEDEIGAERLAFTWDEVAELSERHVIAAHTGTHEQVDLITTEEDLEREVYGPYRRILEVTGRPPAATAFLFGASLGGWPLVEAAIARAGYEFVFSNTKLQRMTCPPAQVGTGG